MERCQPAADAFSTNGVRCLVSKAPATVCQDVEHNWGETQYWFVVSVCVCQFRCQTDDCHGIVGRRLEGYSSGAQMEIIYANNLHIVLQILRSRSRHAVGVPSTPRVFNFEHCRNTQHINFTQSPVVSEFSCGCETCIIHRNDKDSVSEQHEPTQWRAFWYSVCFGMRMWFFFPSFARLTYIN